MKIKTTQRVRDKVSGEVYKKGTILTRDAERAKQFIDSGFAEEVKEKKKKTKKDNGKKE